MRWWQQPIRVIDVIGVAAAVLVLSFFKGVLEAALS